MKTVVHEVSEVDPPGDGTGMEPDKRLIRKLKKTIKRAGRKHSRRDLKRDLVENPEEAHQSELNYGRNRSVTWNGFDQDATRRRPGDPANETHGR